VEGPQRFELGDPDRLAAQLARQRAALSGMANEAARERT
jgi:hypothetical protein